MPVQRALEQPTVISNSFRDSYSPHAVLGKLLTPAMLPQAVRDALAAKGHKLDIRDVKGVGSVKGIMIDPRTGVLHGGVEPDGRQLRDGMVSRLSLEGGSGRLGGWGKPLSLVSRRELSRMQWRVPRCSLARGVRARRTRRGSARTRSSSAPIATASSTSRAATRTACRCRSS